MFMRLIQLIRRKLARQHPEPIPDPQDQTLPDVRPPSVDLPVPGIKGTGPNPSFVLPYGASTPLEALLVMERSSIISVKASGTNLLLPILPRLSGALSLWTSRTITPGR